MDHEEEEEEEGSAPPSNASNKGVCGASTRGVLKGLAAAEAVSVTLRLKVVVVVEGGEPGMG